MSYYEERRRMFVGLETAIKNAGEHGIDRDQLFYMLETKFAVGEKTILKRIMRLKTIGVIQEAAGGYQWLSKSQTAEQKTI